MATIRLNTDETLGFTLTGGDNLVFGKADGEETVSVSGGTQTFDSSFNSGGDTIIFEGASSFYSVSRSGSSIIVTGPNMTVVTFPAPSPDLDDADRPTFVFDDGSFVLDTTVVDGDATVTIGDQEITDTPTEIGGDGTPGEPSGIVLSVEATDVIEGTDDIVYTFTLSEASDEDITINVTTIGGTATAGDDYTAVNQTITFAAGQTTATLTVDVIDDADMNEGDETVTIDVDSNGVLQLADDADLTATITDNDQDLPQSFELTTGGDTVLGGSGADRINGVQNINEPGKLLSQVDLVNGGGGVDTLVLINAAGGASVPNALVDVDLTQVSSVEVISSNYNNITLGAEAAEAGIVRVDTTAGDSQPVLGGQILNGEFIDGTLLNISSAGFTNELTVVMADGLADGVITDLANGADLIDTGSSTFNPDGSPLTAQIDQVQFINQTDPVRITFTSTAAGNGDGNDAGGNLALTAQSEDDADGLVGSVTRFDDEGIRFTGGTFDVRDISGTQRGTFAEVIVGTVADEFFVAGGAGAYLNGGMGDDTLLGSGSIDFLAGGAGDDFLSGGAGNDGLLGGGGDDYLDGGAGRDTMDGGEGSDYYFFDGGEFNVSETITDTGMGADDVDTLGVFGTPTINDNSFEGKVGFEAIETDGDVVVGENAEAAGIVEVTSVAGGDVDASDYEGAITVNGSGDIATGMGGDTINITAGLQSYTGDINAGDGDDTVNAGYAIPAGDPANSIDGGDGNDTLRFGGSLVDLGFGVGNNFTYFDPLGDNFTGFESIVIDASDGEEAIDDADDSAGNAVSYTFEVEDSNVTEGGVLVIDGSALRGDVVVDLGDDNELGGSGLDEDTTAGETLEVDASQLSVDFAVDVTGGAGDDVLTGGDGDDVLTGGAGDDTLTGGAGRDLLDGQEGSDTYVFNGVSIKDTVTDTGTEGTDAVFVTRDDVLEGGEFENFSGIEELVTRIRTGVAGDGVAEVTLDEDAIAAGIRTIRTDDDDIDASVYEDGILVFTGTGGVVGGTGDDEVRIAQDPLFTAINNGPIELDDGDDTLNTYYNADFTVAQFDGGDGDDRLLIGGAYSIHTVGAAGVNVGNTSALTTYNADFGADVVGFETIVINAPEAAMAVAGDNNDVAGNTINFAVSVTDDNVDATDGLTVDASALTGTVTDLGADGELGGDGVDADTTTFSTLTFDGSALSGNRELTVIGGDGDDDITGGAGRDAITGGEGSDIIEGGGGIDTITLTESEAARDILVVTTDGDSARTAPDVVIGFDVDTDDGVGANAGLDVTADVIDFGGATVINTNSASISDGVVEQGSALDLAIDSSTSLLAAIQLVEQEFQSGADPLANNGAVAFEYRGNFYVGEIEGAQGLEAFTDIVQLNGISGVTALEATVDGIGLIG
ncbi:beta strand repeat-containing protein [Sphingomonas japonica]|uniref:Ca2+-binding RTX toxin-like protein n=1 Tax=Sphingomonas japonica TaxID=511662 RepID=A0ABX0TW46_9SPHN|nr:Calx-beta domain-containing protein [Sphingomonas japonica]NIJ22535.1 Ca2+-binding RTX toxin-like protein [Sphingomonas japonica]